MDRSYFLKHALAGNLPTLEPDLDRLHEKSFQGMYQTSAQRIICSERKISGHESIWVQPSLCRQAIFTALTGNTDSLQIFQKRSASIENDSTLPSCHYYYSLYVLAINTPREANEHLDKLKDKAGTGVPVASAFYFKAVAHLFGRFEGIPYTPIELFLTSVVNHEAAYREPYLPNINQHIKRTYGEQNVHPVRPHIQHTNPSLLKEAFQYLKAHSKNDDPVIQYNLGIAYFLHNETLEIDHNKAMQKAFKHFTHPSSRDHLGSLGCKAYLLIKYASLLNKSKDEAYTEALACLKKAATSKRSMSCFQLVLFKCIDPHNLAKLNPDLPLDSPQKISTTFKYRLHSATTHTHCTPYEHDFYVRLMEIYWKDNYKGPFDDKGKERLNLYPTTFLSMELAAKEGLEHRYPYGVLAHIMRFFPERLKYQDSPSLQHPLPSLPVQALRTYYHIIEEKLCTLAHIRERKIMSDFLIELETQYPELTHPWYSYPYGRAFREILAHSPGLEHPNLQIQYEARRDLANYYNKLSLTKTVSNPNHLQKVALKIMSAQAIANLPNTHVWHAEYYHDCMFFGDESDLDLLNRYKKVLQHVHKAQIPRLHQLFINPSPEALSVFRNNPRFPGALARPNNTEKKLEVLELQEELLTTFAANSQNNKTAKVELLNKLSFTQALIKYFKEERRNELAKESAEKLRKESITSQIEAGLSELKKAFNPIFSIGD